MEKYTIYCTESQTKKALELGAPIKMVLHPTTWFKEVYPKRCHIDILEHPNGCTLAIPTAEQMIGWIESISTIQLQMEKQMHESNTQYRIWVRDECKPFSDIIEMRSYPSRKEATLAAIDAALEYLSKAKEEKQ